ncbi:bacteriocin-like protein [Chryseobacterium paridis]
MKNLKKLSRSELKSLTGGRRPQTWIADTSCGLTATTTQDWTPQQASEWRERVEKINCPPPTNSGPSTHLA